MVDFFLELVLEIILEGALEGAVSRKVPLPLRILLAAVLLAIFGGLFVLLLWAGIRGGSWLLILLSLGYLAMLVALVLRKIRETRSGGT